MVAGHLQEKKGFFYIVLNFVDSDGKRKRKWIATGLPVKGNKRKAEAMLVAERQKYQPAEYQRTADANNAFCRLYALLAQANQIIRGYNDLRWIQNEC